MPCSVLAGDNAEVAAIHVDLVAREHDGSEMMAARRDFLALGDDVDANVDGPGPFGGRLQPQG